MSQASSQAWAFYRDVAKNRVVWTVRDAGGYPAPKNQSGRRAQPFWSTRSRVERIIKYVPAYARQSMTPPTISGIAPFFIVADVPATLAFYRDKLGFEVTFRGPSPDDEFLGVVRRDGATIMFKALGVIADGKEVLVEPIPNFKRKPAFCLDAYVEVPDPDALAAEFASRGVNFAVPLGDSDDGLRGFVIEDIDGHGLFFGHLR